MRLIPSIVWSYGSADGASLDRRLLELLAGIEASGSLRAAADALGVPYRSAWGLLQDTQQALGAELVQLERGRGATLTEHGAALLRADSAAKQRLARTFNGLALELGTASARSRSEAAPALRLAASHDPALAALQDALPAAAGVRLEVDFCGSLSALSRLQAGEVDLAGFHLVPGSADTARPFLRHLSAVRDRLVRFVDRRQGLIVARGNPHHLRRLADVAAKRLRFVNRQLGSGTRLLIDAQLARDGLAPSALRGYELEEYTHGAVAATVASGRADAGFGVAAAAAEYDLGFVPLALERYYFALRATQLKSVQVVALLAALEGPVFRGLVERMPGYDAAHAGSTERVGRMAAGGVRPFARRARSGT